MGIRSLSTASISTGVKRSDFWDQSSRYFPPSYESIATVTVGSGGSSQIDFTSIPSTFKHLQIRGIGRDNRPSTWIDGMYLSFNSDTTGSNYRNHQLLGTGSAVFAASDAGSTGYGLPIGLVYATNVSNTFSANIIDILDYTNTNKNTTVRNLVGLEDNTNGRIALQSGLWINTAAITTIQFAPITGTAFNQYSSFALYGIK
jgi:hypothetical protein